MSVLTNAHQEVHIVNSNHQHLFIQLRLVHKMMHTLALRCSTVRRHAVRYPVFPAVA